MATGMATTTLLAWYSFRSGVPTRFVVTALTLVAIAIVIFRAVRLRRECASPAGEYLKVFARSSSLILIVVGVFCIQAIVGFRFEDSLLGTLGNNDVFAWALVADHLLNAANISNIYPGGSSYADWIESDAWGTYFVLALTAKISGLSAVEATPYFSAFCLSAITLSIYEIVQRAFNLPRFAALAVACLTGAGSFFFYIAYHGFYGQLLGTLFYLTALLIVLQGKERTGKAAHPRDIAISSVPFIGLLLVYQSGFPVFSTFAIAFCVIHVVVSRLCQRGDAAALPMRHYWMSVLAMPCGALIAVAALPELALHTVRRAVEIAGTIAGWAIPLIFPAYLLSIPVWRPFPEVSGQAYHYVVAISVALSIHLFALAARRRRDTAIPVAGISLGLLLGFSFAAYLLAYAIKGSAYQVWKLASYIVLPTGFTVNALIAVSLSQAKSANREIQRIVAVGLSICLSVYLLLMPATSNVIQFGARARNLQALGSVLRAAGVRNVVLGTAPYAETMIAFDVLSKDLKLYPLSPTFTGTDQKLIHELDPRETRLVLPAACGAEDLKNVDANGYRIVSNDDGLFGKFYFTSDCANLMGYWGVHLVEGFSFAEPWGTWTVGNKARVEVTVPEKLRDRDIVAVFQVHPFGSQNIVAGVNDRVSRRFQLKEAGTFEINIPADAIGKGVIVFEFLIEHPRPVGELIPGSKDPRLLGLGFVSLGLK